MFYSQGNIEKDSYDNRYYASREIVTKLFDRLQKIGRASSIDWNYRSPNTLTIRGLMNVSDGAILGGFLIDNDKFVSLAETNGQPNIRLNGDDGSGHLAAGNINWDKSGNLFVSGVFQSNNDTGDRIVINPYTRNLQFIGSETGVSVTIGKNITFANPDIAYDSLIISSDSGSRSELMAGSLNVYTNGNKTFGTLTGTQISFYYNRLEPDETGFEAKVGLVDGQNKLIVLLKNCPKNPNGLPVNALWNDHGTIRANA